MSADDSAQDLKEIVTSYQERYSNFFKSELENIALAVDDISTKNEKALDKFEKKIETLDTKMVSRTETCIREEQKLQDHIKKCDDEFAKIERRLEDINRNTESKLDKVKEDIEPLKKWLNMQHGAIALLAFIAGAAITYLIKNP